MDDEDRLEPRCHCGNGEEAEKEEEEAGNIIWFRLCGGPRSDCCCGCCALCSLRSLLMYLRILLFGGIRSNRLSDLRNGFYFYCYCYCCCYCEDESSLCVYSSSVDILVVGHSFALFTSFPKAPVSRNWLLLLLRGWWVYWFMDITGRLPDAFRRCWVA